MTTPTFIFVDGSYFCFYRYFALQRWWKSAYPNEELCDPSQNEKFVEKFRKTFINNLQQIPKKLKLDKNVDKPIIIIGKDCKRVDIWRNSLYSRYKETRVNDDGFMGGPFFQMAYENEGELFTKGGATAILSHPKLEADDCIALSVKHILNKYEVCDIYIITSDQDYLQLNAPNVKLYTLGYKNLMDSKIFTGIAETDLRIKIIMGDKSDNIPSVFPKCGIKTALKCIEDEEYFKKKMNENKVYYEQYELNTQLVDFNCIPGDYRDEFLQSITHLRI